MKTWIKMLIAVAVMAMMAACHPDEKNNNNESGTGSGTEEMESAVYMSVNVSLTGNNGAKNGAKATETETGQEYENNISNMLIVLAERPSNAFITYGTVSNPTGAQTGNKLTAVSKIDRTGLDAYYDRAKTDNTIDVGSVYVYVFCNYPEDLLTKITDASKAAKEGGARTSSDWLHAVCEIPADKADEVSIWRRGEYLMSNAKVVKKRIPTSLDTWKKFYSKDASTSFNLSGQNSDAAIDNGASSSDIDAGAIEVRRVMARFDYKDGSQNGDNTYTILTKGTANGDLQVQLIRIALVNQSRQFYYLQHIAPANYTDYNDVVDPTKQVVCGEETYGEGAQTTYVVDADAKEAHKAARTNNEHIDAGTLGTYYRHRLFDNAGTITPDVRAEWNSADIPTLLRGKDPTTGYARWAYTTENAIPHTNQRMGVATGIVFKGKLLATSGTNAVLASAINGTYQPKGNAYVTKVTINGTEHTYPILYAFGNSTLRRLYAGWNDQVAKAVEDSYDEVPGSIAYAVKTKNYEVDGVLYSPNELYQILIGTTEDTEERDKALRNFKAAAVKANFTLYEVSNDTDGGQETEGGTREDHGYGYYCYYAYWNRHNNGESNGSMLPMEYATVRNNVYRISVKSINYFGHPRISANDPDPMTPDSPCEKDDLYMSVDVQVAPWVVRTNDIEL